MTYIDTRDLDTRRDELKESIEELVAQGTEEFSDNIMAMEEEIQEIDQIENCCEDFIYGGTMIPVDDFQEYAEEFARDIGALPDGDGGWPTGYINWERAARDLAMDYSEVEYQGTDYYVR